MCSTQGILYIRYLQTYVLVSVEFESSCLVKQLSCRHLFANMVGLQRYHQSNNGFWGSGEDSACYWHCIRVHAQHARMVN